LPTRRVRIANNGISANANNARIQLRNSMPTMVATTVVTFEAIDVAVFVTTLWTPPMSFEIRDCTSPVRVFVKNASDRRCRWRKTFARRSCITRCPTWLEKSVWITPSTPVTIAIAIIPAAATSSSVVSFCRSPPGALEQEGGEDAEARGDDDQQQHRREPAAVGREQRPIAAGSRAAAPVRGPVGRAVGGCQNVPRSAAQRTMRARPARSVGRSCQAVLDRRRARVEHAPLEQAGGHELVSVPSASPAARRERLAELVEAVAPSTDA
jgi:hypothetical protein